MQYNNPQPMTQMGSYTPLGVMHKSESHKLHQAFNVKEGDVILQSMPVMLNADGTISPYTGTGIYLGIAITDNVNPAYKVAPVEVTIMVEGFAIVYGTATDAQNAGYVTPQAASEESQYIPYEASENPTNFIALNTAEDEGDLIQVLVK